MTMPGSIGDESLGVDYDQPAEPMPDNDREQDEPTLVNEEDD